VDVVFGDPKQAADVDAALADCEILVQAAGTYSYDRTSGDAMLVDNPLIARTCLEAARAAGLARVVDVSTVGVFRLDVARVDESTPWTGEGDRGWTDPYVRSKVFAARVADEMATTADLPIVAIHPGFTIGPLDQGPGTSGRLVLALLSGGVRPPGRLAWVDVRDVAAAVAAAVQVERPAARYIVAGRVRTLDEVAALLDGITGRRPRRLPIGRSLLRFNARLNDLARGRLAPLPPSGSLEYLLECPPEVDGSLATRDLGITYRPLETTLADAIRWWLLAKKVPARLAGRVAGDRAS
jgi:dihydroflavonol-4-reductase